MSVTALEKLNLMIKKSLFYISILLVVSFIGTGFKPNTSQSNEVNHFDEGTDFLYVFPSLNKADYYTLKIPFVGKYFIGYKEAIARKESQGKFRKVNSFGYLGKYQFGLETLKELGINDSLGFLHNPKLQEKAFITLLSKNKYILRDYIERYEGKIVDGVKITESGILAAAHLGGAGSVIKFLKSNGRFKCRDGYGTSVKAYMLSFGGYETKGIKAIKNAKV